MPRVNVYVPDDLHARIKELQGGVVQINISLVCQQALERVVSDVAGLKADDDTLDALSVRVEELEAGLEGARRQISTLEKNADLQSRRIGDVEGSVRERSR